MQDAIASVRRRSTKDLVEARCDLEATRCRVDQEISALREQGEHVASLVQSKSQDLNVLLNYKVHVHGWFVCVCMCVYVCVCMCVCVCVHVHVYVLVQIYLWGRDCEQ